jgi:hypothetical protein
MAAANMGQFRRVHSRMILRAVPVQNGECGGPDDAQCCKRKKHPAPAEGGHDENGGERSNRDRDAAEAMRHALDKAAFLLGEPQLHGTRRRRKCARLTETEHEAYGEKRNQAAGPGRRRRHHRPEGHDQQQHALRTKPVAEPSSRNLADRVGPCERREDKTHLGLAQVEFTRDRRRRHRNVGPIHVSDQVHKADQEQHEPTNARSGPARRRQGPVCSW